MWEGSITCSSHGLEHLFLKPSLLVLQEGNGFGSVDMLMYYFLL